MPDTGAPYFLPWPDGTDLVRDAPQAFEDLAVATGNALDGASVILDYKNVVKSNTFSTSSTSFVDITDLELTITPKSTSSKIIVIPNVTIANDTNTATHYGFLRLVRGASELVIFGIADGTQTVRSAFPHGLTYVDAPATVSATTYKVQTRANFTSALINNDGVNAQSRASSLLLLEVNG
jgi:hypothetical protein